MPAASAFAEVFDSHVYQLDLLEQDVMDQPTVGMSTSLDSASLTSYGLPQGLVKSREPADTVTLKNVHAEVRNSKVMIIDDEELVIRVVRRFLASDGYETC